MGHRISRTRVCVGSVRRKFATAKTLLPLAGREFRRYNRGGNPGSAIALLQSANKARFHSPALARAIYTSIANKTSGQIQKEAADALERLFNR